MLAERFDTLNSFAVNEVASVIPGRPSTATIWRWILAGLKLPTGERVKLRSFKSGGRRFVHRDAVSEFLDAMNGGETSPESESPDAAERRGREAGRALEILLR